MDYNKVLEYHIAKKADITVVCKELGPEEDATRFGTDPHERGVHGSIEFEEKPMVATFPDSIDRDLHHPPQAAHRSCGALCGGGETRFCNRHSDSV